MQRVAPNLSPRNLLEQTRDLLLELWSEFAWFFVTFKSRSSTWRLRAVSHRVLDLMKVGNLRGKEQEELGQLMQKLLLHSQESLLGLQLEHSQFLRAHQPQLAILLQLLRSINPLQRATSAEIFRFKRALETYLKTPAAALVSDLKMRALLVSAARFGQSQHKFAQMCSMSQISPLAGRARALSPHFAEAEGVLKALRGAPLWNSRMVLFHTRRGFELLHPELNFIHRLRKTLSQRYLHTALLHSQRDKGLHCWHITFHKLDNNRVGNADMSTSEILQLEAAKLLIPGRRQRLVRALNLGDEDALIEEVNRRLERAIDRQNVWAEKLHLTNSLWARSRIPLCSLTDRRGMQRGSTLRKGQVINCAHYVASVLFRAVEEVNRELSNLLQSSERTLKPVIDPKLAPSGFIISRLFKELQKVSIQIAAIPPDRLAFNRVE